jgi:hypothetical protein
MNCIQTWLFGLFIFSLFSCSATKRVPIKSNFIISYTIPSGDGTVQLDVHLSQSAPQWVFDYVVKGENLSGTIVSPNEAVQSSTELYHTFNGLDKTLTSGMSLRLSTASYQKLKAGYSVELSYRQGFVKNTLSYKVVQKQRVKYFVDGKQVGFKVLIIEDNMDKGNHIEVWDNPQAPLIFRLNLGFEMEVKEMRKT